MAEVNQVPEIAVSPEIADHFQHPSADPPTQTFMRAITPVEELTHTVDYDAFAQRARIGTRDNPNLVVPEANVNIDTDDMMLMAAAGAPKVVGAAMSRAAEALGLPSALRGRAATALYRQTAAELSPVGGSLSRTMDETAAKRAARLAKDLGISPGPFGRFAPRTAPDDIRVMRIANRTVAGLGKPGFKPLMPPQLAKDLVAAQKAYYDAATPFLLPANVAADVGQVAVPASREALSAAYVALRKQLGAAGEALAAQKSPAGALASQAWDALSGHKALSAYETAGRLLVGMQRYDKYGTLSHDKWAPIGLVFDKLFVDPFTVLGSAARTEWRKLGTLAEVAARVYAGKAIINTVTKPSRDAAGVAAGDEDIRRREGPNAFGLSPQPGQPAPVAPTTPAPVKPSNPYDAAFMF